ncbi:MAG TPA: DUF6491 family protein [Steroidobacteraceae bacterium]|nr:DUF6491 family protein [Steroidobacteraceae bacterium]
MKCWGALAALAALGACATVPPDRPGSELPARERYMPYVGPPIERFTWMMPIDGFEALSDSELIVFMGANTAYYLKVWAPCGTKGLRFSHGVGLSSSVGGTVTARLDSVQTQGMSCPISEIRPLDYKRMKEEARAGHAGQPDVQR